MLHLNSPRAVVLLLLTVVTAAPAQDSIAALERARDAFRAALRKPTLAERRVGVAALQATKEPKAVDDFLGALRTAGDRIEKLREEIARVGQEQRDAWKVVDEQNSNGREPANTLMNDALKKQAPVQERLKKLDAELQDVEQTAYVLVEAAGALIVSLDPVARAAQIFALGDAAEKARPVEDRLLYLRVLSAAPAAESRDVLVELLARSNDPAVRTAAADSLLLLADSAAAPALGKALGDEAWPVRAAAARALGALPAVSGASALVEAMAAVEGRTLDEVVLAVENLGGVTYFDNAALWKEWWAKEGEGLKRTMDDLDSQDRATRVAACKVVGERGLLAGVRKLLLTRGLIPERDAAAKAPSGSNAPKVAADPGAEEETRAARDAIGAAMAKCPKPVRLRALTALLLAPATQMREIEDFERATAYVNLMGAVIDEPVRTFLRETSNKKLLPDQEPDASDSAGLARHRARKPAADALTAAAKEAHAFTPPSKAGADSRSGTDPEAGRLAGGTTFYGIATHSKRILYILDVSRSMLEPAEGKYSGGKGADEKTKSKLDVAKNELIQSIRGLPEDATFNIVFFSDGVETWKPKPVLADKAGKAEGVKRATSVKTVGATNIFDALERGFALAGRGTQDKRYSVTIDTVYFMSDGRSNRGRLIDPAQILAEVTRLNSEQKLKIHVIGVGKDHDKALMQAIAAATGGTYVAR
jgi:hypothetical protein